jgi:4-hydroxybenzoate polyprenyltransferase
MKEISSPWQRLQEHAKERAPHYWNLIRADRPIGWLLLLWPTWWGLWLSAKAFPSWKLLIIFSLGVWLTRSAGCIINDVADRWLDGQVQRTQQRPLVAGHVSKKEALLLFCILMLIAFVLVLFTNTKTIVLSVVAVFLAASYPYLKRYTYLPQIYLGLAFGFGIPMAYTATHNQWPSVEIWLLYVANLLWTTGYDTWYAMVDRDDDIRMGSKSTAILLGDLDLIGIALLYLIFFLAMFLLGQRMQLGVNYYLGLCVAIGFAAWQFVHARDRVREHCFAAFKNNGLLGLVISLGIIVHYLIR